MFVIEKTCEIIHISIQYVHVIYHTVDKKLINGIIRLQDL